MKLLGRLRCFLVGHEMPPKRARSYGYWCQRCGGLVRWPKDEKPEK